MEEHFIILRKNPSAERMNQLSNGIYNRSLDLTKISDACEIKYILRIVRKGLRNGTLHRQNFTVQQINWLSEHGLDTKLLF